MNGREPAGLQLEPVDTWYLADGTPSGSDLSGGYESGGVFPPHPATVVGTVRAALARANGWSGQGAWPSKLVDVLGDGYEPDSLGTLAFDGPYLLRNETPHHPVPAHLVGGDDADGLWRVRAAMRPGEAVLCDLGEVRLPVLPDGMGDARPARPGSQWLPEADLAGVLNLDPVNMPAVARAALWREERRVGIARNAETRTVQEQMLYTATHVRPCPGVTVGVRVSGLPAGWRLPAGGELVPFGGEGRMARCHAWDGGSVAPPAGAWTGRFVVVALSPLDLDSGVYRGGAALAGLGGARVVSACLPQARQIGGWRSVPRSEPLPLHSVLPAGRVLFCDGADPEQLAAAVAAPAGPLRIGQRQRWGFGAVALAPWPGDQGCTVDRRLE
jgi:CRISPR-associated protein Cmr3